METTKLNHSLYGLRDGNWTVLARTYLDDKEREAIFAKIERMCNPEPYGATMTGYVRAEPQSFRFGNVIVRNHFDAYRIQ